MSALKIFPTEAIPLVIQFVWCTTAALHYIHGFELHAQLVNRNYIMTTIFISYFHDDQNKNRFYCKMNTKKNIFEIEKYLSSPIIFFFFLRTNRCCIGRSE